MSGPKSSRYTLTPEQRRILAEQRRIERARAVAKANIKRHTAVLRKLSGEMQHDTDVAGEAISRLGDDGGYYKKVGELHLVKLGVGGKARLRKRQKSRTNKKRDSGNRVQQRKEGQGRYCGNFG